ncbi:unnamed protein product [Ixodes persulcatus]
MIKLSARDGRKCHNKWACLPEAKRTKHTVIREKKGVYSLEGHLTRSGG